MKTPQHYKTQSGLIKAMFKVSEGLATVKSSWWLHNANFELVNRFGWGETEAAKFVAGYQPTQSAYRAAR